MSDVLRITAKSGVGKSDAMRIAQRDLVRIRMNGHIVYFSDLLLSQPVALLAALCRTHAGEEPPSAWLWSLAMSPAV
ncbi:hypothetical protein ACOCG7_34505 (plasmid) [Paraburkholderia sp. DD10]|uniref:hypothetical protein n=1 Tax=Paraburkholderia sp. DD10 TaxID=3409691 RepID=UPI003B9E2C95